MDFHSVNDELFQTKTGYNKLDERIQKTQHKKDQLLPVLQHPVIPLHNNNSELGRGIKHEDVMSTYTPSVLQGQNQKIPSRH
jgi:hypothetical protein